MKRYILLMLCTLMIINPLLGFHGGGGGGHMGGSGFARGGGERSFASSRSGSTRVSHASSRAGRNISRRTTARSHRATHRMAQRGQRGRTKRGMHRRTNRNRDHRDRSFRRNNLLFIGGLWVPWWLYFATFPYGFYDTAGYPVDESYEPEEQVEEPSQEDNDFIRCYNNCLNKTQISERTCSRLCTIFVAQE